MSLSALIGGYARRKRWEAKLLAVEVVRALGEAMGEERGVRSEGRGGTHGAVSAAEFARIAGGM